MAFVVSIDGISPEKIQKKKEKKLKKNIKAIT